MLISTCKTEVAFRTFPENFQKVARYLGLAKMVKQYFAVPGSSGGVERVFSAAGKMHDDLTCKKSAKDATLEEACHCLQCRIQNRLANQPY